MDEIVLPDLLCDDKVRKLAMEKAREYLATHTVEPGLKEAWELAKSLDFTGCVALPKIAFVAIYRTAIARKLGE